MKYIDILTIDHKLQRYQTVGDYSTDSLGRKHFFISKCGNSDYEFLIAMHELIESYLCEKRGIKESDIDAFDIEFEQNREPGNVDEPGNCSDAPYHKEHMFATYIEEKIAKELGVNWDEYEEALDALYLPSTSTASGAD